MEDIAVLFLKNWDTASDQVVWDVFKAFSLGILISLKTHRNKSKMNYRDSLIEEIQLLDHLNKEMEETLQEELTNKVKILDVQNIVRNMFS